MGGGVAWVSAGMGTLDDTRLHIFHFNTTINNDRLVQHAALLHIVQKHKTNTPISAVVLLWVHVPGRGTQERELFYCDLLFWNGTGCDAKFLVPGLRGVKTKTKHAHHNNPCTAHRVKKMQCTHCNYICERTL